ncbi:PaaX family transcriptional regulator [Phytoactinopolyspora mesophila]|uniref:PaaX family transcriptional regulator n=1 Tax=Phytoactinopolyspora mesophila TaxID=2650750 RepID=A0A7K3LX33_9ACTN|nr:PaaX family transcriptional regulator C-terminal domain-containing protein [Phytoactinopolyspora mesophila]NDL55571.1 PaaX family transcriptional regulator [Phytoactinopolyspora mesophila]
MPKTSTAAPVPVAQPSTGTAEHMSKPLARARSQRLLVTLFGDYWDRARGPIPSAGLVRVLEEFGIAPANARAALSRMTQRGALARTKDGRRTSYAPTESTLRQLERGAHRIFASGNGAEWDGTWTLIAFSLPLEAGDLRRLLRARLRWLTFWPIYDATWVTPHDRLDAACEQLAELNITDAVVLRTTDVRLLAQGRARLEDAWQLGHLADAYRDYLNRFEPLAELVAARAVTPTEALVGRGELVDEWRRLVRDDPDLPDVFLPAGFPRARARDLFLTTYRALERPARARFDELTREA